MSAANSNLNHANLNNANLINANQNIAQAHVTTITREVALAEEKLHSREEQHIQPILTRDIEQKEVHQILQPLHETKVLPTQHETGSMAIENREVNMDRPILPQALPEAVRVAGRQDVNVVQHAPIVEERFHKTVVEEIQPVLYRDVIQPREVIITQPIHERIVEAPVVIQETRSMVEHGVIELGTQYVGQQGSTGLQGTSGNFGQNAGLTGQGLTGQGLTGHGLTGQGLSGQGLSGQGLSGQNAGLTGHGLTGQSNQTGQSKVGNLEAKLENKLHQHEGQQQGSFGQAH